MVSVDNDTSTNDTMIIMANGLANNKKIDKKSEMAEAFQEALNAVCIFLAKAVAADGEGAGKLIEVNVCGAKDIESARICARTIATSSLVKTAIHGCDPNWGRIIAAKAGVAEVVERKWTYLSAASNCWRKGGIPLEKSRFLKQWLIRRLR